MLAERVSIPTPPAALDPIPATRGDRPPRAVVIDSGIDPNHPLVRGRGAVQAGGSWATGPATEDPLGHGTAVAAVLLSVCPGAELVSLRIFDDAPVCPFERVLEALDQAIAHRPAVINLSLGTTSLRHRAALHERLARLAAAGGRLCCPASYGGLPCDPGNLPGVEAVVGDPNLLPQWPELRTHHGRWLWFASPLPPRNLDGSQTLRARGESLAVAAVSGLLLRRAAGAVPPAT